MTRQARGKTFTHGGRTLTLAEWGRVSGIDPATIRTRLRDGVPFEEAISRSARPKAPDLVPIEFDGESRTVGEWAEATGIPAGTIIIRLRRGWPVSRALTEPVAVMVTHAGITLSVSDWAASAGIPYQVLRGRLGMGWSMERALSEPIHFKGNGRMW